MSRFLKTHICILADDFSTCERLLFETCDCYGSHLAGDDLLQGVLTFDVGVISHDDHDNRHELIHQGQGAVLQLSGQDAL